MSFYGFVYILGFILVLLPLGKFDFYKHNLWYRIFISVYAAIGAIVGGRLGYVCIYEPSYYFDNHIQEIIQIYKGGMSYHFGVIGLIIAVLLCDKKGFWINLDKVAIIALIIIPLGRLANFYNGELWGVPTSLPWGVVFEGADTQPRHPVQIYEAIFEGPLSAIIIFYCASKISKGNIFQKDVTIVPGLISSIYGMCYGYLRAVTEFVREPDRMVGLLAFHFTMGQLLSLFMGIISTIVFIKIYRFHKFININNGKYKR